MLKLFKEQKISIYKVQKDLGLEKKRLYRYATKEYNIEKMPIDLIMALSSYFHIEMNQMYKKMVDYLGEK